MRSILAAVLTLAVIAAASPANAVDCTTPIYRATYVATTGGHHWQELADLNGDGKGDLVTSRFNMSVSVLLAGVSSFGPAQTVFSGPSTGLTIGDFTSDGALDIITGQYSANTFVLVRGNGNGTFAAPSTFTLDVRPSVFDANDLNGDGKLDLVFTSWDDHVVVVLHGDGAGGFTEAWRRSVTITSGIAPAAGDFDDDGTPDFVFAQSPSLLTVEFGNGAGFDPLDLAATGARDLVVSDLDGDGRSDIIATALGFAVYLATPLRTFAPPVSHPSCSNVFVSAAAIGDVTGDGKADVAAGTGISGSGYIQVWAGDGLGGFGAPWCNILFNGAARVALLTGPDAEGRPGILIGAAESYWYVANVCGRTTMSLHGPTSMPVAGDNLVLEASVSPIPFGAPTPTGDVIFKEGDTVLGQGALSTGGLATITIPAITVGEHHYSATYAGENGYYPNSATGVVLVAAAESTVVISGPAESAYGDSAIASFGVDGPWSAGHMQYSLDGGAWTGGGDFNFAGIGVGTHTLVARYNGGHQSPRGMSAPFTHVIRKATPTFTVTPPTTIHTLQTSAIASWQVTVYGYGNGTTGTVTLMRGAATLASGTVPSPGLATTLPIGTHSGFYVTYSGNTNFEAAQSPPTTVTVVYNGPATFNTIYRDGQVTFQYQAPNGTATMRFFRQRLGTIGTTEVPAGGESVSHGVYIYWYTAHNASGTTLATTNKEVVVAMPFAEEDLAAGATVKAAHFEEILTAANLVRAAGGLAPVTFPTLTPGVTTIAGAHLTALRDAINQGRIVIGASPFAFSDVPLGTLRRVRLLHMLELRDSVR